MNSANNEFNPESEEHVYDSVGEYTFILRCTWVLLFSYLFIFVYIKAWFSFVVIGLGVVAIVPFQIYLAYRQNPVYGRVSFLATSAFFIAFGSLGANHLVHPEYFLMPASIVNIILFRERERKYSLFGMLFIIMSWTLIQIEAKTILPEEWIATQYPTKTLNAIGFYAALALSTAYLYAHSRNLNRHHLKIQESTLKLNQQRLEALGLLTKIANNIPGVVYQFRLARDGKTSFPFASDGINKIYRVSPKQVLNDATDVYKTLHPDDIEQVNLSIQQSAENLTPWRAEYRVQFNDGAVEWRRGIAHPQKELDGSILWHGFIMDITNEKKLEEDLQQSQITAIHNSRLASLGEMAGGIAHEINNPLTIISSKATLIHLMLSSDTPKLDRARSELEKLNQTAFRIAGIVKGLLTFARGDKQIDFQNVLVENIINDVGDLCGEKAKSKGIKIHFESDKDTYIYGRSVQIAQILLNLINNSIDAIASFSDPWIKVKAQRLEDGEYVRFTVSDCGTGISPAQQAKLMQPFFTTKAVGKGTGLGLSISKGLVENHGGQLKYDSNSKNTSFYFDLKIVENRSQGSTQEAI